MARNDTIDIKLYLLDGELNERHRYSDSGDGRTYRRVHRWLVVRPVKLRKGGTYISASWESEQALLSERCRRNLNSAALKWRVARGFRLGQGPK